MSPSVANTCCIRASRGPSRVVPGIVGVRRQVRSVTPTTAAALLKPHVRAAAEKRERTAAPRLTYKFPRASTWQLLGLHSEHERSEHR